MPWQDMTHHPLPPRHRRCIAAAMALGLALPASAQAPASIASPGALACLIQPAHVAEVGSPVIGVIEAIDIERGDLVRKGQVLVRLRAEVERASTDAMRSRALSEAELRGAVAARDLAMLKLERTRRLKEENFVSTQAVEQAHAELRVAHERVAQVRESLRTLEQEVAVTSAQVAQRTLRAPFDGVVVERYANPGERFEDKPLLKLASIHMLRVEVVAPTALFGVLKPGQALSVLPELPGAAMRQARIAQVDRVLDPASNTFRLRLDLPNPDASLPAGLRCKVDLGLRVDAPAHTPAPPNGAAAR